MGRGSKFVAVGSLYTIPYYCSIVVVPPVGSRRARVEVRRSRVEAAGQQAVAVVGRRARVVVERRWNVRVGESVRVGVLWYRGIVVS